MISNDKSRILVVIGIVFYFVEHCSCNPFNLLPNGLGRFPNPNLEYESPNRDFRPSNPALRPLLRSRGQMSIMDRLDLDNLGLGDQQSSFLRPRPRCNRRIRIANGVTRFRDKGSFVRYACSHGFTLLGATIAVCLRDQWSEPPPICVKPGCRRIQDPRNGMSRPTFGGAVVSFFCNDGYEVDGNPVVFCDGNHWNGTEPVCFSMQPPEPEPEMTTEEPEPIWDITNYHETTVNHESDLPAYETTENPESWDFNPLLTTRTSATDTQNTSTGESSPYSLPGTDKITTPGLNIHDWDQVQATSEPPSVPIPVAPIAPVTTTSTSTTMKPTTITLTTTTTVSTSTPTETEIPTSSTPATTTTTTTIRVPIIPTLPPTLASTTSTATTTTTTPKPTQGIFLTSPSTTLAKDATEKFEEPFPDHTFDKFDEELGFSYTFDEKKQPELIQPIVPISPHKLDDEKAHEHYQRLAHATFIGGTILGILGSVALLGGFTVYCWRKNHGIARATRYDTDGRTLSADANDDFMWMDSSSASRL